MSRVVHIEDEEHLNRYLATDKPLIIKFSTRWCRPCKRIQPFFEELSKKYVGVAFLCVDAEDLSGHYLVDNVNRFPTFYIKNAGQSFQWEGSKSETLEENMLKFF